MPKIRSIDNNFCISVHGKLYLKVSLSVSRLRRGASGFLIGQDSKIGFSGDKASTENGFIEGKFFNTKKVVPLCLNIEERKKFDFEIKKDDEKVVFFKDSVQLLSVFDCDPYFVLRVDHGRSIVNIIDYKLKGEEVPHSFVRKKSYSYHRPPLNKHCIHGFSPQKMTQDSVSKKFNNEFSNIDYNNNIINVIFTERNYKNIKYLNKMENIRTIIISEGETIYNCINKNCIYYKGQSENELINQIEEYLYES